MLRSLAANKCRQLEVLHATDPDQPLAKDTLKRFQALTRSLPPPPHQARHQMAAPADAAIGMARAPSYLPTTNESILFSQLRQLAERRARVVLAANEYGEECVLPEGQLLQNGVVSGLAGWSRMQVGRQQACATHHAPIGEVG